MRIDRPEPWQEQADIPEDSELLDQLPQDDAHPTYVAETDDIGPDDHTYSISYDRVIALDRSKYNESEARMRFNSICVLSGCRPTEPAFYTKRHWCLRVTNGTKHKETDETE